jgi:uncharacterized protein (DUF488 family)
MTAFWRNQSFHNYADYALSETFQFGFARLRALGQEQRCALMCAEAVSWRCHCRLIADYLIAAGETVFHILGKGHMEPAHMAIRTDRVHFWTRKRPAGCANWRRPTGGAVRLRS